MSVNRTFSTLRNMLQRVVEDKANRQQWYELLGEPLYNAAAEWLIEYGIEDHRGPEFADMFTVTIPPAVAEAYWAVSGEYHPQDSRHPDNQDKIAITVPKIVADAFHPAG